MFHIASPDAPYHAALNLDPFFASVRREPRYQALFAAMTQDVAEMRKRAADAHPALFGR